jgi:hypothetical protein
VTQALAQIQPKAWSPAQLHFQVWLATPRAERQPKSQRELARELNVNHCTLSEWKRLPGWGDAVYALAEQQLRNELVPILDAQVREAKKGSLPHAQWCFELAGAWSPKQKHEHTGPSGAPLQFTFQIDRREADDRGDAAE